MEVLETLFSGVIGFAQPDSWKLIIMWIIGGVLIFLAIKKQMEPTLLLPIGFGAILMNFPGVVKYLCEACGNTAAYGETVCGCGGEI